MGYGDTYFLKKQGVTSPTAGVNSAAAPAPATGTWVGGSPIVSTTPVFTPNPAPAPEPSPPPTPPADPNKALMDLLKKQADDAETARLDNLQKKRTGAFDSMRAILSGFGIDIDGSFTDQLRSWIWEDRSSDAIMMDIRKTTAYNKRFTGMADLIKRGQFMDEATYIAQERAYHDTMQSWGLPKNFYDDPTDYGRFIANGVSVKELDDRIASAKTFLDNTDPAYRNSLRDLYGVSEGGMLAYVLDGDKAQAVLQQQFKSAAFSGAAGNYDFQLTKDQAEKYGATLGDQYNRIGADQIGALTSNMASLDTVADNQQSLAFIDKEDYARTDTLDAQILSDTEKQAASQRRALREKARFSGSSAFGTGSMARSTGV